MQHRLARTEALSADLLTAARQASAIRRLLSDTRTRVPNNIGEQFGDWWSAFQSVRRLAKLAVQNGTHSYLLIGETDGPGKGRNDTCIGMAEIAVDRTVHTTTQGAVRTNIANYWVGGRYIDASGHDAAIGGLLREAVRLDTDLEQPTGHITVPTVRPIGEHVGSFDSPWIRPEFRVALLGARADDQPTLLGTQSIDWGTEHSHPTEWLTVATIPTDVRVLLAMPGLTQ